MQYEVIHKGKKIVVEKLPNGKFKIPSISQFIKNAPGCVNFQDCRIPYESRSDRDGAKFGPRGESGGRIGQLEKFKGERYTPTNQGRFPANLLCSDDVLNDGKISDARGGILKGRQANFSRYFGKEAFKNSGATYNDIGSFSRYFSLDAWFDKKLKELPKSVQRTFPFLIVPKASKSEKNKNCEDLYWEKDKSSFGYHQIDRKRWEWLGKEEERIYRETGKRVPLRARGSIHPTVKPLKLGSYLVTIGSRRDDVILDPFGGSGWTAIVAKSLGRHYVVFETEPENVRIAKARLSEIQLKLF